mmetsp:Transcript_16360/g.38365  ORF Transcript_16360/g.38365 Transcript_16360/m.38365 type:complete len:81 (+) Transcript_16360:29-271(+)
MTATVTRTTTAIIPPISSCSERAQAIPFTKNALDLEEKISSKACPCQLPDVLSDELPPYLLSALVDESLPHRQRTSIMAT